MRRVTSKIVHPGDYLRDELKARKLTAAALARIVQRPASFLSLIMCGRSRITPRTAQILGDGLGTSAELWINLQRSYETSNV